MKYTKQYTFCAISWMLISLTARHSRFFALLCSLSHFRLSKVLRVSFNEYRSCWKRKCCRKALPERLQRIPLGSNLGHPSFFACTSFCTVLPCGDIKHCTGACCVRRSSLLVSSRGTGVQFPSVEVEKLLQALTLSRPDLQKTDVAENK